MLFVPDDPRWSRSRPEWTGPRSASSHRRVRRASMQVSQRLVGWVEGTSFASHSRWLAVRSSLAITGESAEEMASKVLVAGGVGLLGPLIVWVAAQAAGIVMSPAIAFAISAIAGPGAAALPMAGMSSEARERRRHFRIVIGSFVDLVVLGLAGGVGIEGALYAASQVTSDWAAARMARALSRARDGGLPPWSGLGQLGEEIAVPELVELASALELAGTEGARLRSVTELEGRVPASPRTGRCRICSQRHD